MKIRRKMAPALLFCFVSAHDKTWVNPCPAVVGSYVYAPAVLASEILMSRYCPTFVASTGECVSCSKGIEVLRLPASSGNLAEIELKTSKQFRHTKNIKTTHHQKPFLHRILEGTFQTLWYGASYLSNFIFGFSIKKSNTPASTSLSGYCIDLAKVNLAQEEDLKLFKVIYDKHVTRVHTQYPLDVQHAIVLYGTSRGSATIFNFCALEQPQEVHALVCEGLFDSIDHVYRATRSLKTRFMINALHRLSQFDENGIAPLKLIKNMPRAMPILLITSRKDYTVPWQCTMNMYTKLRKTGHNNVHILMLEKAGHAWYPYCRKNERMLYQNVVHAFYKKYNLPYIPEYAQEGWDYLITSTQPPFTESGTWDWEV